MTVIALFEDLQLAISDVMISVEDSKVSTITPTTGNTSNLPNLGLGVSRLARKLITGEGQSGSAQLLVAGTLSHIEHFAKVLREVFRNQLQLPNELNELIRTSGAYGCMEAAARLADADGFKEFEVVGVAGELQCAHTFDAQRIVVDIPYFGKVWIAGSGAINLLNWMRLRGSRYEKEFSHFELEARHFHIANLVTLFLMEEDIGPLRRTIKTGVGGYYEAYTVSPGMLTPIGDSLTVIANISGRIRDRKVLIKRLMYHCYKGETLYVFSVMQEILVTATSPVKIPLTACKLFDITPLIPMRVKSSWNIHRVASQMLGAKNVRTILRKAHQGNPITKRFIRSIPGHRLIKISLSGNYLLVSLDLDGFQYFSKRFPTDLSDVLLV